MDINSKKIVSFFSNSAFIAAFLVALFGFASFAKAATTTLSYTGDPIDFFTVPQNVTSLTVTVVGGGAGAGGGAYTFGGGGGGAGASIVQTIPVTPGQIIAYTVGAGGVGGSSGFINVAGGNGANGGNTTFGTTTAFGGKGGKGAIYGVSSGGKGGLAGGLGGTNGTDGDDQINTQRNYGGNGGTTALGTGGIGGFGNATTYTLPTDGTNGNGGGAGSGWASGDATLRDAGANGGNGVIVVSFTPVPSVLGNIAISPLNPTMMIGSTTQFIASTTDQFGNPFATTTTWSSSSSTVGTIDPATGLFTALSSGTTTVTATAGTLSTSTVVTVSNLPPVLTSINLIPLDPTVIVGGTMSFTASTTDQYGNPFPATIFWGSSNSSVGSINLTTGLFTAASLGTTTITAVATNGTQLVSASTTVTVANPAPVLTSISISPLDPMVSIGQTVSFTASTTDQFGQPFATTTYWTSSDTNIGTIDNTGLFTAFSTGTTTITATAGTLSTSTVVTVSAVVIPPVTTISITNSTIEGTYYLSYATTSGAIPSLTGTTTVTDSTTTLSSINNGDIATSTVNTTAIADVNLNSSTVTGSTLTNDDITRCTILNSSVKNYLATDCYIAFSVLDPSTLYSFVSSTSTGSQIFASNIFNSVITNAYIATSTINASTITSSTSTDSTISTSTITDNSVVTNSDVTLSTLDNTQITDSTSTDSNLTNTTVSGGSVITDSTTTDSTIASSTLTNVTAASSTITNTTLSNASTTNAVIDNNIIDSGTITIGGNTYVITTPTPISSLGAGTSVPVTSITVSGTGGATTVQNGSTLQMIATVLPMNASTSTVAWSVANGTGSATIDPAGLLTGTAVGDVMVTASSTDGSGVFGTTTIAVTSGGGGGPTLSSIAITTPANKLIYTVGDTLDVTGLVLTETFSDNSTATTSITNADVSGFDSSVATSSEVLTVTFGGQTTTYTIIVNAGNSGTPDVTAPVITILGANPVTILVGATYTDAGATALDNVDGDVTASIVSSSTVDASTAGTYFVTYTVSDAAGNTASASRTVHVVATPDTIPPVITVLGSNPDTISLGSTYTDQGATATDNVDGNITQNIISTNNVNTAATGTYTVNYSVTDGAGNVATTSRTVFVVSMPVDTVPPVITITGGTPVTVFQNSTYTDQGALAFDAYDNATTSATIVSNNVNTAATGTYFVIYSASDLAGNVATVTRTVIVQAAPADTIPPVITITGGTPTTVIASSTYTDAGATALDNVDGVVPVITLSNNVDTNTLGTYSVVYEASDTAGNIAQATRTVNVILASSTADVIPPVITITGGTPVTIYVGSTYTDQGATAIDDVDGPISATTTSNNVNPNVIGTYQVVYSATDAAGNTSTATRTVNVIARPADTIPPVITLNGGTPITITQGSAYTELGATATDNVDGTDPVVPSGTVDTTTVGTYIITYTATDAAGNTASTTRTVNVVAVNTTAPVITVLGSNPVSIIKTLPYTDAGATAIDSFDGDITAKIITTGLPISTAATGTFTVVYSVTDSAGLSASSTRVVNVIADNVPPVITINGSSTVTINVGTNYVDAGATAIDNVDGDITANIVTTNPISSSTPVGTYFVIYRVSDSSGNQATPQIRTVNIVVPDTIPPVLTLNGANPMDVTVGTPYVEPGATAIDNVDGNITNRIVIGGFVNANILGTYTVTYNVSDTAGNAAPQMTRTVNVVPASSNPPAPTSGGGGNTNHTPPTIVIIGQNPATVSVGATYTDAGANAYDATDNTLTSRIVTTNSVNTSIAGTYTVTYRVADNNGNVTTATRTVNVVGTEPAATPTVTPATTTAPTLVAAAPTEQPTPTNGGTGQVSGGNNTIPFVDLGNILPPHNATTSVSTTSSSSVAAVTPARNSFLATVGLALESIPKNVIAIILSIVAFLIAGVAIFRVNKN